jgi:uncharacterized membrane protein YgcG
MTTLVLIVLAVVWACVLLPPWLGQRRGAFDARTTWFESPENESRIRNDGVRRVLAFLGLIDDDRHDDSRRVGGFGGFSGFGGCGGGSGGCGSGGSGC